MRRRTTSLLWLVIFLGLSATVLSVAATEAGSRWLVNAVLAETSGLSYRDLDGTLLTGMTLTDVNYRAQGGTSIHLDTFSFRWSMSGLLKAQLYLDITSARNLVIVLGEQQHRPDTEPPRLALAFLAIGLDDLSLGKILVRQKERSWIIDDFYVSGELARDGLVLDRLHVEALESAVSMQGRIDGDYPYRFDLDAEWKTLFGNSPPVRGKGHIRGDLNKVRLRQQIDSPYNATVEGLLTPEFESGNHRFDLRGQWSDLSYPLGEQILRSGKGRFTLQGILDSYSLTISSDFKHSFMLSPAVLDVRVRGSKQQLSIESGHLSALGGKGLLSGQLDWGPTSNWKLALQADGIDPGLQWPEAAGRLGVSASLQGRFGAGSNDIHMQLTELTGSINHIPVSAHGEALFSNASLQLKTLIIESGENQITMAGMLMPGHDIELSFRLPRLQNLGHGMHGYLQGNLHFRGDLEKPAIKIRAQGHDLALGELGMGALQLDIHVDPENVQASALTLSADTVRWQSVQLDTLAISGEGNTTHHLVRLDAQAWDSNFQANLKGTFTPVKWSGKLNSLTISSQRFENWGLDRTVDLVVSQKSVHAGAFCLGNGTRKVCSDGLDSRNGRIQSTGSVHQLPLSLLNSWLEAVDSQIDGFVNGEFRISRDQSGLASNVRLHITPGVIRHSPYHGGEIVVPHKDGRLVFKYDDNNILLDCALTLPGAGHINALLKVSQVDSLRRLEGTAELNLANPALLSAATPYIDNWKGPIAVSGNVSGTLVEPQVSLHGTWREGGLSIPALGIDITKGELKIEGQGTQLSLSGGVTSGKGRLRLDGSASFKKGMDWTARLAVTGENFQLFSRPDLEATISPKVLALLDHGGIKLTGDITVPHARIAPISLPKGAVNVSDDEVIVSVVVPANVNKAEALPLVEAELRLFAQQDVRLNAYGLQAGLEGNANLHYRTGSPLELMGQLHITDGRYVAYGQNLEIERGVLLFGGPISNTVVDLRAVRHLDKVTVGFHLSGPLSGPVAELFSEPPMSEADALSYIITGGPVSDGTNVNLALLTQAAYSYGLEKTTPILMQMVGTLGLDEMSVVSGEEGMESGALALSKQIRPNLFVRYLYGLFDGTSTLQLRYNLSEHIRLEGGAGTRNSLDIIYELERD